MFWPVLTGGSLLGVQDNQRLRGEMLHDVIRRCRAPLFTGHDLVGTEGDFADAV